MAATPYELRRNMCFLERRDEKTENKDKIEKIKKDPNKINNNFNSS